MSLFSETMRLGRKTVTKQEKNYADCVRELNSIDPKLEGSKLYDETAEKIKQRHETERKRIGTLTRNGKSTLNSTIQRALVKTAIR